MSASRRPSVCVVTAHWGDDERELDAVVRLVAGALAGVAEVQVVLVDRHAPAPRTERDSVFSVHHVPLLASAPALRAVAAAALVGANGAAGLAPRLTEPLDELEGRAPGLEEAIGRCAPDVLLLAGLPMPFAPGALEGLAVPRVVYCPLLTDLSRATERRVGELVAAADAVGSLHPGEQRVLEPLAAALGTPVVPLDIALTLNRAATAQGLFGVAWFGRYVLSIRRFPRTGARYPSSVTRELLRSVLGKVAIAEVDGTKWRVTDFENTAELPVNPTRVNLWRLMAHAVFTIDLRPPTPFGREAIESLLFGAPALVPEGSAGHAHVEAAGGGLWYATPGEVLDASVRLLDDEPLRRALSAAGKDYALAHHGDMDGFVERTRALVFGPPQD